MPAIEHATDARVPAPDAPRLPATASLRDALSPLLATDRDAALIDTNRGEVTITLGAIRDALNGARR